MEGDSIWQNKKITHDVVDEKRKLLHKRLRAFAGKVAVLISEKAKFNPCLDYTSHGGWVEFSTSDYNPYAVKEKTRGKILRLVAYDWETKNLWSIEDDPLDEYYVKQLAVLDEWDKVLKKGK